MKYNSRKNLIACAAAFLLACVLVIVAICGHVLSKYASTSSYKGSQVTIDDFWFTVDILGDSVDEETSTKTIDIYGGDGETLEFNVRNYFDSLRITSSAVTYTITVESEYGTTTAEVKDSAQSGTVCSTSSTTSSALTFTDAQTAISGGANDGAQDAQYYLVIDSFSAADTVTVSINSSAPFTKTLKLVFELRVASSDVYCTLNNNTAASTSYLELVLATDVALSSGIVTISWSSTNYLQFDNTNSYFTLQTGNVTAVNTEPIKKESSVSVKFFKTDTSKIYTVSPSVVTVGNNVNSVTITIKESN